MTYDPERHRRRSIRAKTYDYAQPGSYVVTICISERADVLGEVVDGPMVLNAVGTMFQDGWRTSSGPFPGI